MRTLFFIAALMSSQLTFGQTAYEKAMGEALEAYKGGKNEEAIAKFERITHVEKDNWIPAYYQAMVGITSSFQVQDAEAKNQLLAKATVVITKNEDHGNVSEWLVLKAMALTSELTIDPMNKSMTLSPQIIKHYKDALALDPNNPRALYGLASFNIETKKYTGGSIDKDCEDLQKAVSLFHEETHDTPFYPNWGKDWAEHTLQQCQTRK